MSVYVHRRVSQRHPELIDADVHSAWESKISWAVRLTSERNHIVAVGFDSNGRLIEMVAVSNGEDYLIFHAMTPPSKKTLTELGLLGRKG